MKERYGGLEDAEEEIRSYLMTLKKREDTGNGDSKDYIALCPELATAEATDPRETDYGWMNE
jgi:hypothetical protein